MAVFHDTTTLPQLHRRSLLAGAAGALAAAAAPAAAVAARAPQGLLDWRAVRLELLDAYEARKAANEAYDRAVMTAGDVLPPKTAALVPSPNREQGRPWDWQSSVRSFKRDAAQVDAYFDKVAGEARAAAMAQDWPADLLEDFFAEGERHRAAALRTVWLASPERLAQFRAATADAEEAADDAYVRYDVIEATVRELPMSNAGFVAVKLMALRHQIDPDDAGYAHDLIEEMLLDLVGVDELQAA